MSAVYCRLIFKEKYRSRAWEWIQYMPRHTIFNIVRMTSFTSLFTLGNNIKLQSAMQRESFIKSFHPTLAMLREDTVQSVKDDRMCRALSNFFCYSPECTLKYFNTVRIQFCKKIWKTYEKINFFLYMQRLHSAFKL